MEYTRLGTSGLKISRIALGCMSFGEHRGFSEWSLGEEEARPFFARAVELGITFWDTANVYQLGSSEEIVGKAITTYSPREDIVLVTKVHFPMHDGPGGSGLSRKAIMEQIDASLTRLGTDYVDLYQIHRFDPNTPVDETMEALHDVVKAGKARYLGASSMYAWQFAKMQHAAELHGWTKFVAMQDLYNLLQREEEREMFGLLGERPRLRSHRPDGDDQETDRQRRRQVVQDAGHGQTDPHQRAGVQQATRGTGELTGPAEDPQRHDHRGRNHASEQPRAAFGVGRSADCRDEVSGSRWTSCRRSVRQSQATSQNQAMRAGTASISGRAAPERPRGGVPCSIHRFPLETAGQSAISLSREQAPSLPADSGTKPPIMEGWRRPQRRRVLHKADHVGVQAQFASVDISELDHWLSR
jgi:diketogulonate reductase-like aldo/keto reductase